jgi:hypothetical protein
MEAARHMLRFIGPLLGVIAFSTSALGQKVEESRSDNIGPWEIEATYKSDQFDRCTITRKTDDVVVKIIRRGNGLELTLSSAHWQLERGKRYPVHMRAGPSLWETEVAAETDSVSVMLSDKSLVQGLRRGSVLKVEGAGSTIQIPLNKSRLALDRLEECFEKNSRGVESNPFVKPQRGP